MKPTKGPYYWREETLPEGGVMRTLAPGILIPEGTDGTPWGDEIDQANARLLAKSWEMWEALTSVLRLVDNAKWRDPVGCPLETAPHIEQARALLREIEGESE